MGGTWENGEMVAFYSQLWGCYLSCRPSPMSSLFSFPISPLLQRLLCPFFPVSFAGMNASSSGAPKRELSHIERELQCTVPVPGLPLIFVPSRSRHRGRPLSVPCRWASRSLGNSFSRWAALHCRHAHLHYWKTLLLFSLSSSFPAKHC